MISQLKYLLLCIIFTFASLQAKEKYYLSVCAIFRNEARFLKEWIEYHRMIGVEHFYLYNHLSEDHFFEVLEPYMQNGIIELFDWPYEPHDHKSWTKIQCAAYNDLVKKRGKETFWLAIIDTDEFIVPIKKPNLSIFLQKYEKYGGIGINWQLFGTSSVHRIPDNQTLIGTLLKRGPTHYDRNRFVKTIFQPSKIKEVKKPHHCKYLKGYFHVTENKKPFAVNKSLTDSVSVNKIQINHYTYRDEEFLYGEKFRRITEWFPEVTTPPIESELDLVEDTIMLKYVPALEERLFNP